MLWCWMVSAESWITLVSYIFCQAANLRNTPNCNINIMFRETQQIQEFPVIEWRDLQTEVESTIYTSFTFLGVELSDF